MNSRNKNSRNIFLFRENLFPKSETFFSETNFCFQKKRFNIRFTYNKWTFLKKTRLNNSQ
jgi:hypothetical protein